MDCLFKLKEHVRDLDFEETSTCICHRLGIKVHPIANHVAATGTEIMEQFRCSDHIQRVLLANASEPVYPTFQAFLTRLMGDILAYFRANHVPLGPPPPLPVLCVRGLCFLGLPGASWRRLCGLVWAWVLLFRP